MKNIPYLLFAFFLGASFPVFSQQASIGPNVKITPAKPQAGAAVRFEYTVALGPLAQAKEIEAIAVEFEKDMPVVHDVQLTARDGRLYGSFTPSAGALTALLVFRAGEKWDNNDGEGYFIALHDAAGKPLVEGPAAQAMLYRGFGGMFELNRKPAVAHALYEQAFTGKPELKDKYFNGYLSNLSALKRDGAKTEGLALLGDLERRLTDEKSLMQAADLYERYGAGDRAATLRARLRSEFPKGLAARKEKREQINYLADLAAREAAIEAFVKDFPAESDDDRQALNSIYYNLARKYADQANYDKLRQIAAKIEAANRANLYNGIAWNLAENGKDLQQAKQLSEEATRWAEQEWKKPSAPRPVSMPASTWKEQRGQTFAQLADTYAYILDKLGDPAKALPYQRRAVELMEGADAEMNERYTAYLERTNSTELLPKLEEFLGQGKATSTMREQFKRVYTAGKNNNVDADTYLQRLDAAAAEHLRQELAAGMLDYPAPAFTLKNLAGETVSLEKLRGKVVVVDFWATWCGPCKMSFPGMQQAVNQYKDDAGVAFVFVDCWERGNEKEKNVGDFIKSKNYTFNVLMDSEDRVVADYGVSGIPTKFVVGPEGNVRFKAIGYNGSTDALVKELTMMIELARKEIRN